MKIAWQSLCSAIRRRPGAAAPRHSRRLRLQRLEMRLAPAAHDPFANAIPLAFDGAALVQTAAAAPPVTDGTVLQGSYVPGSTTYYQFSATATGRLTASVTATDASSYLPQLALYGSAEQLLIQNDATGATA